MAIVANEHASVGCQAFQHQLIGHTWVLAAESVPERSGIDSLARPDPNLPCGERGGDRLPV